jgi:outer membrane protein assembly factor BamB
MRRVARWWRISLAAAIIGCWGLATAEEQRQSSRPDAEKSKEIAPLEEPTLPDSPKKPQWKPAKKASKKASVSSRLPATRQVSGSKAARHRSVTPIAFTSKEGRTGWKAVISSGQPLATPAVAEGKVFIGGGLTSRDFFALDAETGDTRWHYPTADNGPTSPTVYSGYLTFSTESCELEVLTTNGERVWKKLLGSPLISQPAVADGQVIASFPVSETNGPQQYLASFALKTGNEQWRQKIAGEVIAAPVIENRHVLVATVDGGLHCFRGKDGKAVWTETGVNATSAPTVWLDRCWFGQWQDGAVSGLPEVTARKTEKVASRGLSAGGALGSLSVTNRLAEYLGSIRSAVSPRGKSRASKVAAGPAPNSATGLGDGVPPAADGGQMVPWPSPSYANTPLSLTTAQRTEMNLGTSSTGGLWSYQGSRPLFYDGRLYVAMGDSISCVDIKAEKIIWKKEFRPEKTTKGGQSTAKNKEPWLRHPTVTPPVLVNQKVFIGTSYGELLCLSATTGELLWKATIGNPIVSQLAVAGGRVYACTKFGVLYCLETDDRNDDGWLMWGGDARHTGRADESQWKQASNKEPPLAVRAVLHD